MCADPAGAKIRNLVGLKSSNVEYNDVIGVIVDCFLAPLEKMAFRCSYVKR